MRIAEVIGKVTLSKMHPSLQGARWLVAVPYGRETLENSAEGRGEPFVVFDELGGGEESVIGVSEGAEASGPFYPDTKPIDAYCAAIFDQLRTTNNST